MHRLGISIAVGALVAFGASAETSAPAGAQTSGQASVEAGKTQAQAGASSSTSAAASAQNGQANAGLSSGTTFNAELSSPLDSKKAKPGDAVNGRTTEAVKSPGKMVIPKLLGRVTKASSRAKGEAESSLGIIFDKAILKNGEEVPLNVAVQALASAQSSASAAGDQMDTMGGLAGSAAGSGMAGGRGAIGGVTSAAGGAAGTVTNTATTAGGAAGGAVNRTTNAAGRVAGASEGAVGGLNAAGQLTSNSQGVFGLNGLHLNLAASNATEGTIITSSGKNVHLDSGTRLLLVTEARAGSSSEQGASKKPATGQQEKP
jgi:trimeric autotransporter adhesin